MIRRLVPYAVLPLALIACFLASSPWLRAFPSGVMAVPLVGASLLAVLLPVVVIAIGIRKLWLTALIDILGFVFFSTLVTLREPAGFADIYTGLVHGPSQILTFALPLVSPRTLLVAPVALCWLSGAVIGECLGRGWQSVLPYATLLVTFGLAYAATTRAITNSADGRRYDTLLAGGLLVTLLLLRAAQAWVEQDTGAEQTQVDGQLPLRGLVVGIAVSVLVAGLAGLAVQASAFSGPPTAPKRVPPLTNADPLTPLAFIAGLRPTDPSSSGSPLFTVTVDRSTSRYVAIADVDTYDGDGWSFDRRFLPSGGVVPADADTTSRSRTQPVTQQYRIDKGAMTTVPWMPFQYRPAKVSGTAVNVDALSGMVVPSIRLHAGQSYTVRSETPAKQFGQLSSSALSATSPPPSDTYLPPAVANQLGEVVDSLRAETGSRATDSPIVFLQALQDDLRTNYALSGGTKTGSEPGSSTSAAPPSSPASTSKAPPSRPRSKPSTTKSPNRFLDLAPKRSSTARKAPAPRPTPARSTPRVTPAPSATPTASSPSRVSSGGTSFANVLASILGQSRSATPEQYATLVALVARQLGVPARVVAGFRIGDGTGTTLQPGSYAVTTKQAWTWVEIPIRGAGWVVLDASPGTYSNPKSAPSASARPTPPQSPSASTPNALLTQASSDAGAAVAKPSKVDHARTISHTAVAVIVVLIVVAVLLAFLLALVLRKRLRARRRRRAGDPRRRLIGAWQEGLDVLVESGLTDVDGLTSAEVAAATAEHFGNESAAQARFLGDSANAAIFSPTSWIGAQEADAAWQAQTVLRRSVRRRLSFRERVGAGLRYHRHRKPRPLVGPSSWAAVAKARATGSTNRGRRSGKHAGRRRAH